MSLSHSIKLSRNTLPAFAAEGIFWGAFAAYVPELKAGIGASDGAFGMVLLASAIGAIVAMWLAPVYAARTGRFAMAIAALIMVVTFQGPVWVSSIWLFAGLFVFAGASTGLLDVVMNARLSVIESRYNISLMNLNHAGFSFAYAAGALVAGVARENEIGPKLVFFALLLMGTLLAFRMIESKFEHSDENLAKGNSPLPKSVFWGGLIILIAFMAEQAVESWSALHIERSLHGGAGEGAIGPALLGLTMGFGRLGGQFIAAHISATRVVVAGAIFSAIGALIAAAATSPAMAYFGFGLLGVGVSVLAPMAFALIGATVSNAERPAAISQAAIIGYVGFFIGPPLLGFAAQATSLRVAFVLVAAVLMSAPLFIYFLKREE